MPTEPVSRPKWSQQQITVVGLIQMGGVLAGIGTALGFFGRYWWFFDLFAQFKVQYFAYATVFAIVLALRKHRPSAKLFVVLALINLVQIVPLYTGGSRLSPAGAIQKAVLMNVNSGNGDPAKVQQLLKSEMPDLLVLEEISDKWLADLSEVLKEFPHSKAVPQEDDFGIGLFSKHPLQDIREFYLGESQVPTLSAVVELPGGSVRIFATHPLPPSSGENAMKRDQQLSELAAIVREEQLPIIVLGDLNTTPWGHSFSKLRGAGLLHGAKGRGITPTWPTYMPFLYIPLDHCFHSPAIAVTKLSVGPRIGSDHLPLIVEWGLVNSGSATNSPPASVEAALP